MAGLLEQMRAVDRTRHALQDHERSVSYSQLAALVHEEGRWLADSGERIALLAENGVSWALADLALHEFRKPSVPLPAYFTAQQLQHVVADAAIDSILTDRPRQVLDLWPSWKVAETSRRSGLTLLRADGMPSRPAAHIPPDTSKITYTSGSTAAPKGVCLNAKTLESVARSLADATAGLEIERHLCLVPLPTLLENIAGIYASLLSGATCIAPPASITGIHYGAIDAQKLLAAITRYQPESLILVPELLRLLMYAASRGWTIPPSLKFIAVGGAAVSAELLEEAAGLRLPVFQGYGLSECASVVCLNTPTANRVGSVGKPLPHAEVRIDTRGEIFVRGATMSGYLGDDARDPDAELATGDLGEMDADGFVYIKGRLRNIFITSVGRNLSPEWIEKELTRETYIRHAIVLGEARPFPVALIAPPSSDIDSSAIERAVSRANCRLPDYARVRRWALFPETPTIENGLLTPNGRLRRESISKHYQTLIDGLYEDSLEAETT